MILAVPGGLDVPVEPCHGHIWIRCPLQFTGVSVNGDHIISITFDPSTTPPHSCLPAQLSRDEVAVRTVLGGILVHAAEQSLLAGLIVNAQLREYRVYLGQNGAVEGIDGSQVLIVLPWVGHRLVLGHDSGGSRILITGSTMNVFTVCVVGGVVQRPSKCKRE